MEKPSWALAVTTAPRRDCTLLRTLESIADCAWDPPTVFAEPGSTPTDWPTVWNDQRLGVWFNWLQSARWALEQNADFIMTVQDDTEFHPQSRELIESIEWPQDAGYVSLYTPKHYQFWKDRKTPRKLGLYSVNTRSMWGACALVFRPEVLAQLVDHPRARSWLGVRGKKKAQWPALKEKRRANPWMIQNSDTIIGSILVKSLKRKLYYFNPSPACHIAQYSAIGHGDNKGRRNAWAIADPSIPLAHQIFEPTIQLDSI